MMTELEFVKYINHLYHPSFIDKITILISNPIFLASAWIAVIIAIYLFNKKNYKPIILSIVIALVLHFIISEAIFKHLIPYLHSSFFRLRPWRIAGSGIIPLGKKYLDSSFPSSHMSSTLSILTIITYNYKKFWPVALILTIIMAFARIHNGMHFPSDVLAGTILGIGYGALAILIVKKYYGKY